MLPISDGASNIINISLTKATITLFALFSDTENCDIPGCPATSDYDIPSATANEGFSDVPRSYEDLRMSSTDDKTAEDGNVLSDFPEWTVWILIIPSNSQFLLVTQK